MLRHLTYPRSIEMIVVSAALKQSSVENTSDIQSNAPGQSSKLSDISDTGRHSYCIWRLQYQKPLRNDHDI
jgi:hypothetical protein